MSDGLSDSKNLFFDPKYNAWKQEEIERLEVELNKQIRSCFYTVYTTPSWRTFMCLRCVHGYKCLLRVLSPAALDILIDLDEVGGKCAMFYKRNFLTKRMRYYHNHNTSIEWTWYKSGILRKRMQRASLAFGWSAFKWLEGR